MTPDEIRRRAEKQTQEFNATLRGDNRKTLFWRARELANFNSNHLPADQPFNDLEFLTEWANRLIQAAKILSETDLLKYLDAPTRNTNELFGVQVLKAAAEEDRNRCIELLRLGFTDAENQGIYSDGIRWAVWKFIERLEWPETDPVRAIEAQEKGPEGEKEESKEPAKRKREKSKKPPGKDELFFSALLKHHDYKDGGCGNFEPASYRTLAELSGIPKSTIEGLFDRHFGDAKEGIKGNAVYRNLCKSKAIVTKLKSFDNPGWLALTLANHNEVSDPTASEDDD